MFIYNLLIIIKYIDIVILLMKFININCDVLK
jgi:hypothetical protein